MRPVHERRESVLSIEACCTVIFGVDQYSESRRFRARRPPDCIAKHRVSQASIAKADIDSKSTYQGRWDDGISRKLFGARGREVGQRYARSGKRVVGRDAAARNFDRNETVGNAPAYILRSLFAEIAIKPDHARGKR